MRLNYCMFQISAMWRSASSAVNSAMAPYDNVWGVAEESCPGKKRMQSPGAVLWHLLCSVRLPRAGEADQSDAFCTRATKTTCRIIFDRQGMKSRKYLSSNRLFYVSQPRVSSLRASKGESSYSHALLLMARMT